MSPIPFIVFSLFTLACASGVVIARSPIHSAFCLILSFFGLAGIYALWGATFIATIQILVYAGAIVVLMVFVIMMLNLSRKNQPFSGWMIIAIASLATWSFALLFLRVLSRGNFAGDFVPHESNMRVVSKLLFTQYLWPFEVLSLFLLAMIVGIYVLTRPEKTEKNSQRGVGL